jgi:hypothetical protein
VRRVELPTLCLGNDEKGQKAPVRVGKNPYFATPPSLMLPARNSLFPAQKCAVRTLIQTHLKS